MNVFIPHKHTCEVKLCYPTAWKEHCPRMGNLSDIEDECETCEHFVTIEFLPENPLRISKIIHVNVNCVEHGGSVAVFPTGHSEIVE